MANESTEFDGVDDVINFTSNVFDTTGATSFVVVVRILAADGTWLSFIETEQPAGSSRPSIGRRNNDEIYYASGIGIESALDILASDSWLIAGWSRPAGAAQTIRAHRLIIGGATTHQNMATTFGNDTTDATIMRFGGNDDFANIRMAACGVFDTNLADSDYDNILSELSTQSIIDAGAVSAYDSRNGALGTDLVGSCDESSRTGTTQSTDGPAGWTYFGDTPASGPVVAWLTA